MINSRASLRMIELHVSVETRTCRSLTQKSVRKQVIQDLGLDEAISDMEQVKLAIRNAVKDAVVCMVN